VKHGSSPQLTSLESRKTSPDQDQGSRDLHCRVRARPLRLTIRSGGSASKCSCIRSPKPLSLFRDENFETPAICQGSAQGAPVSPTGTDSDCSRRAAAQSISSPGFEETNPRGRSPSVAALTLPRSQRHHSRESSPSVLPGRPNSQGRQLFCLTRSSARHPVKPHPSRYRSTNGFHLQASSRAPANSHLGVRRSRFPSLFRYLGSPSEPDCRPRTHPESSHLMPKLPRRHHSA
jgi:hypothetical protein